MEGNLVERIRAHVVRKHERVPCAPAQADVVREAEAALGFNIPPLLKSIYLTIGNGGFGPGYGIAGVTGGAGSDLGTLVETYREILKGAEYLGLPWCSGLLPFCGWGCNIFSCVDCNDPFYGVYQSEDCVARQMNFTLDDFFDKWVNGESLLEPGSAKHVAGINPFNGASTSFAGRRNTRR